MSQHTPGPWIVRQGNNCYVIEGALEKCPIQGEARGHVASTDWWSNTGTGRKPKYEPSDRQKANARLLRAAPELLAACKDWVDLYQSHKTGDCTPPGCSVCRVRALIAEVEG
jgi:hypothetical protein